MNKDFEIKENKNTNTINLYYIGILVRSEPDKFDAELKLEIFRQGYMAGFNQCCDWEGCKGEIKD